ncbi:type II secretion system protein GspG [Halioglobus maricola]|uniref:Type II secretion system core protein G n=1 Tax=Halioglobus maricola TaxID=2601894 RepID=A0A5P9NJ71_9GAMM|nr:type II secretion system major pseudopilin GspG [Halioglobus maricola]QFU75018.1 type II secretion system protein GspG [Halioglobus maricola]
MNASRQAGFSLVEILVVLVIMGLLISVVAPTVLNQADDARVQKVHADFKSIETALKIYRLDNYVYPTTEQGLDALVEASTLDPEPRNFKKGGYLSEVPLDPWGRPYLYLSPGENGEVDIYSLGADGLSGGEGQNADVGNWKAEE